MLYISDKLTQWTWSNCCSDICHHSTEVWESAETTPGLCCTPQQPAAATAATVTDTAATSGTTRPSPGNEPHGGGATPR